MLTLRNVSAGLLALTLGFLPAPAAEVDKYLPNDTEVVVTVNVRQILDAPLVKKYALEQVKGLLKGNAEAQKVLDALGFDPFKDFASITLAETGFDSDDKGLVIARGKFDTAKFQTKAEEVAKGMGDLLKIHKLDATRYYELKVPGEEKPLFIGLLDDATLVAAQNKDYTLDAVAKKAGKKTGAVKKEVQTLIEKADASQSLWMVATGSSLLTGQLGGDEKAKKSLGKIDAVTSGITLGKGFAAEFVVAAKTAEAAQELAKEINEGLDQAKGLVAILAGNEKKLAPAAEILGALKTTTQGKTISVKGEVSEEAIEKGLK